MCPLPGPVNSSREIRVEDGLVKASGYDRGMGLRVETAYRWDGERFVLYSKSWQ